MKLGRQNLKLWIVACGGLVGVAILTGCGIDTDNDDAIDVVTTIYPVQYLTSAVAGGLVNVAQIDENIGDSHTFEPNTTQILRLNTADAVFYISELQDGWLTPLIGSLDDGNFVELGEDLEDDVHRDGDDPHIWLDPVLAIELAERIRDNLVKIDPANRATYAANAGGLIARLNILHRDFEAALNPNLCASDEVIVNHNLFEHLGERYGFTTHSLTSKFAHETTTTPSNLANAIELVNMGGFTHILVAGNSAMQEVQTLIDETGVIVAEIHSLEFQAGDLDYFGAMRANLNVLIDALRCFPS